MSEFDKLRAEIARLKAAEEGAKIAYQTIVDEKQQLATLLNNTARRLADITELFRKEYELNQEAQAKLAMMRERIGFLISCVKSGEQLGSREEWVMEVLKR